MEYKKPRLKEIADVDLPENSGTGVPAVVPIVFVNAALVVNVYLTVNVAENIHQGPIHAC